MNSAVIDGLKIFLSDTYILYIKTQNFHWNVEGPGFGALHALFQTQYEDLRDAADLLAERIRALGDYAPGSCSAFSAHSRIAEETRTSLSQNEMIRELAEDNRLMASHAREFAANLEEIGESATAHLILDRVNVHEKAAWMLESHLRGM